MLSSYVMIWKKRYLFLLCISLTPLVIHAETTQKTTQPNEENPKQNTHTHKDRIGKIVVIGNALVPTAVILDRIPYRVGTLFDPITTRAVIRNLYYEVKRFKNISIYTNIEDDDSLTLYIQVEEKPVLKEVVFEGNKNLPEKEIREKINFDDIRAINIQELEKHARAINKLYKSKGYHNISIESDLIIDNQNEATAKFIITEHNRAALTRINFAGNDSISSKQLRSIIFSQEDWIFSVMDKTGILEYERLDYDKHLIEQHYQNNGFLYAKVVDTKVDIDENTSRAFVTHIISEGDKFTVQEITVDGKNILREDYVLSMLPIQVGDYYSRQGIVDSIKALEFIWGDMGYTFAQIDPAVLPNTEKKTVSIAFNSEIGSPVRLNKLNIKGNKKTRDKVVRRKISLEEGMLLTNRQMDASKSRIESLGYFEQRDGVNWKLIRLDDKTADLDLLLKEAKTGSAHFKLGFGGAGLQSPSKGVSLELSVNDTNLFGSGIKFNLTGQFGSDEQTIEFNLTQPWICDKPIYGALDLFHKRVGYDEFNLTNPINEKHTGGSLTTGFVTNVWHHIFSDTFVRFALGIDDIRYENKSRDGKWCSVSPKTTLRLDDRQEQLIAEKSYNTVLRKLFDPGTFVTFTTQVGNDSKNHPMHPSRGHAWVARSMFAIPSFNNCIGFHKFDLDINWYTPLIGDYDLIFRLHTYFGMINSFSRRFIPYRELFHIGGPASVRGFFFGQIGPQFRTEQGGSQKCDSIGAKKTFFMNAELIFPITNDFTIKGVAFYDGGAGWDSPCACDVPDQFLINNRFNYRHSVGVGIRMLNPMPIKVDWGFKLDPRKGETGHEVHFGMTYDW